MTGVCGRFTQMTGNTAVSFILTPFRSGAWRIRKLSVKRLPIFHTASQELWPGWNSKALRYGFGQESPELRVMPA